MGASRVGLARLRRPVQCRDVLGEIDANVQNDHCTPSCGRSALAQQCAHFVADAALARAERRAGKSVRRVGAHPMPSHQPEPRLAYISIKLLTLTLLGSFWAFGAHGQPLAEAIGDIRSVGWAPTGAELSFLHRLPRPPSLGDGERTVPCRPSRPTFASAAAQDLWTRRPLARTLTVWGIAHFGARAASKIDGTLCQDLAFMSRQWQLALGSQPDGSLTLEQVMQFNRAVSDVEWGRESHFVGTEVGMGPSREVQRLAAQPVPTRTAPPAVVASSDAFRSAEAASDSGLRRAQRKNCMSCHDLTFKMIGPSVKALAAKHASDPNAATELARSLTQGSQSSCKFVDGSPLSFQTTATEAELREIIEWMIAAKK